VSVVSGQKPVSSRRSRVDTTRVASGPVWRQYLRALGPGLVTGASDDDPSGIATYCQAGAKFGFGLLWLALLTLPLMAATAPLWQPRRVWASWLPSASPSGAVS